ncbi:MAG TPA: aminotransferase class III-fold pyridoxal phosphate-dependent enzyme [Planctomycetota bacterium]|nr:aminotransferase class III-fold pyridoxal phosphate-dependent enzyme [Planctomycetota bacterium]
MAGSTRDAAAAPARSHARSADLARAAEAAIAGGVVSLNRKVEPRIAFVRAQGARLWDADGNEYLDYHGAFAPHLLGHNDPEVNGAVSAAMAAGWSLMGSGTTPWEVELAQLLRAAVPSLELVQLTNSGSEATAHAIRLSRAVTGREHIVLTLGGYNGWHNDVARTVAPALTAIGPRSDGGEYPFLPSSAGIPAGAARLIHVVAFNDVAGLEAVMKRHPIACVLTEPVLQNVGVVAPRPGYLAAMRGLCDAHGAVLVFDEVKTGFRCALGGYQSLCGVRPDLSVFGKAVANGWPLGVIGGRADLMRRFDDPDPAQRVLIAGTYNAHPFTTAAAIATIRRLRRGDVHARLEALGARLEQGLDALFRAKGVATRIARLGSAFCAYHMDHLPVDWHDIAAHHDAAFDVRLRRALIERGVYQFPAPIKQGSISFAHSDADIERTLAVYAQALADI